MNLKDKLINYLKEEFISSVEINDSSSDEKFLRLEELKRKTLECKKCNLYKTATNLVFSDGDYNAELVFVGEAPGEDEDLQGKPFVGRAGKLLTATIEEFGLKRQQVYICNILKHRPPENRNPEPEEVAVCSPFLLEQLTIIKPKLIVTLGNFSTRFLLDTKDGISKLRGTCKKSPYDYMVLPTYHPAAVLRNMNLLTEFREDIKKAISYLSGKV
ncbi:MAG: uracil-DNA glycosylase [Brevinematales bacterium]|nr:uracil-DNA glycosylase [Brevinematales bacterium]